MLSNAVSLRKTGENFMGHKGFECRLTVASGGLTRRLKVIALGQDKKR